MENVRGNTKITLMPSGKVEKRQRVVTTWRCLVCKTDYGSRSRAESCARMRVEPRLFKKGDRVTWNEPAVCQDTGRGREFRIKATVVKVTAPAAPDEEYNLKWLAGRLTSIHVRQYEVSFKCLCGKKRSMLLYAPEMKKRR